MAISSEEFVRFQNGDQTVFKKIYDEYVGLIQYVVSRCGASTDIADDIVQETFVRLYTRGKEIQQQQAIKTWLITTARRLTVDHQRANKHRCDEDVTELMSDLTESDMENQLRELEISMLTSLIKQVCHDTGDDTLKHFYIDGRSAKEIASSNGEPIGTVTNRLSRLRKRFNSYFKQHIETLRDTAP